MMWTEKYRNHTIDSFFGNESPRSTVIKWLKTWVKGTKPLLLVGPPGSGKTSFVKSVAKYMNYDLIELNASDVRNKINLEEIINPMLNNSSIFGKRLFLFLDEIDGISGRDDYGGLSFLTSILKESGFPIIMAANSKNMKIKELLKNSKLIEFRPLTSFASYLLLEYILYKEDKKLGFEEKIDIVQKGNGDARSLINILQMKVDGNFTYSEQLVESITIEDCVNQFFSAKDIFQAKKILSNSDIRYSSTRYGYSQEERNKDIVNALFTSIIANERWLSVEKRAEMLNKLSEIDLFINKIYKNRDWNLLKYANDIVLLKLFAITRESKIKYSQYTVPFPLMGSIFIRGQSLKPLRQLLSHIFHVSSSEVGLFYFSYLIKILNSISIADIYFGSDDDIKLNELISKEKGKIKY